MSKGKFRETETRALLASGHYPARKPDQNIADLKAQIAANEKGAADLKRMVSQFGLDVVQAYMGHVRDNAEESVRRVIGVLKDGSFEAPMDIGDDDQGRVIHRSRGARRDHRLHRHEPVKRQQFQRAPMRFASRLCFMSSAVSSTTTFP